MARVKRGTTSIKRRRRVLKAAKGFRWAGSTKEREAKVRLLHAGVHAFHDRRKKKRVNRKLWNIKINAASRSGGELSYSRFIYALKKKHIEINRKMLAEIAEHHPEVFQKILEEVKK
ncbi:MAG: 50S ribosomal protein L20 [bacterium]|nr:50S ribosomal protein L20 [bacterium]